MIWWAVMLFASGMALILAEFFLPGGVLGTLGAIFLVISGAIGVYYYPDHAFFIILAEAIGAIACIVAGLLILAKTRAGKNLRLDMEQRTEEGYIHMVSDLSLVGAEGVAMTMLRPAGTIELNGRRIDAVANGTFIEQGQQVRVLEVHGNRVVVEALRTQ